MAPLSCGLDFGTSNSTAGLPAAGGGRLVPLEGEATTLPSAIFFDFSTREVLFGREAIDAYIGHGEGRLMRAVKSVLATDLIDQDTQLDDRRISFQEVIALLLRRIKERVDLAAGSPVDAVVHGRPVHFVDDDPPADARAEAVLESIARSVGFREVSFQFEPIAAALHYEAQIDREELALIADIGGGTSDFSIVRIGPERARRADRKDDILANQGIRVGGTDLDRLLSLETVMPLLGYRSAMQRRDLTGPGSYFRDLATWSKINFLYARRVIAEIVQVRREARHPELFDRLLTVVENNLGHALALEVERGKVALSEAEATTIDLSAVEPALGAGIDRADLAAAIVEPVERVAGCVRVCLDEAGLRPGAIDTVFLTGGSTLVPAIREGILATVPEARAVDGDRFGSVGLGLAIEAGRRYGQA